MFSGVVITIFCGLSIAFIDIIGLITVRSVSVSNSGGSDLSGLISVLSAKVYLFVLQILGLSSYDLRSERPKSLVLFSMMLRL